MSDDGEEHLDDKMEGWTVIAVIAAILFLSVLVWLANHPRYIIHGCSAGPASRRICA